MLTLSEESERVSELKSLSGSGALPAGLLANGAEGIKEAIQGFDEARKSDIENERLPPDIIDPDVNMPASPSSNSTPASPVTAQGLPASPSSPTSPTTPGGFRRGHARQTSLGTTRTSPSTRRRSLENTMELIRDVVDGRDANADQQVRELAEVISSPTRARPEHSIA